MMRQKRAILILVTGLALLVVASPAAHAGQLMVNTDNDMDDGTDGFCSLREAMQAARLSANHNECTHSGGTDEPHLIQFSGGFTVAVGGTLPDVVNDVTVDGSQSVAVDGGDSERPFRVVGGDLTLTNLTVQNGSTSGDGGAVLIDGSSGSLTALVVTFTGNSAGSGGAISSDGKLVLSTVNFFDNESTSSSGQGGAISFSGASASMTVAVATFTNNGAANRGGAIAVTALGDPINTPPDPTDPDERFVFVTDAVFLNNSADGDDAQDGGGALWVATDDSAFVSIQRCEFLTNSADDGGGGAILLTNDSRIAYVDPLAPEFGGIFASHFQGNSSGGTGDEGVGGAIFSRGELTVVSSSFLDNSSDASSGGAIGQGVLGSGLDCGSTNGNLTVANVTFSGNTADDDGGAVALVRDSNNCTAEVINSTFSDNAATNGSGGAIFNNNTGANAFEVANSILANSTAGDNCGGEALADLGGNVQFPGTACGAGIPVGDPMMESPFLNPGPNVPPVLSMSLLEDSAALGAGDQSICDAGPILNFDARGIPTIRPDGDPDCDSGAYESMFLGGEPMLAFTPSSLDFGPVTVGQTATLTATLENTGDADAENLMLTGPAAPFSLASSTCPQTLPPQAQCTVDIDFSPTATGNFSDTVQAAADGGVTATLNLDGEGVAQPMANLVFTPSSHDFGAVQVGDTVTFAVTLENAGNADAENLNLTGPAAPFGQIHNCPSTLPPQAQCTVTVEFSPTATGNFSDTVTATADGGATATLTLLGEGIPVPVANLVFMPSSHDFGQVQVGDTVTFAITLENTGNADATNLMLSNPVAPFGQTNACPATLQPMDTCTVTVEIMPTAVGTFSDSVVASADDGVSATLTVDGEGVAQPVANLVFTPASHDFGQVQVGGSDSVAVTLENTGDADATNLVLSNPAVPFGQTNTCPATLPPMDTCTVTVEFTPTAVGTFSDNLVASADGGVTATLSLAGEGAPAPGAPPTPEGLDVDGSPIASDGNGVFEPGERVEVAPAWRNNDTAVLGLMGTASGFAGPPGGTYTEVATSADYGAVAPGAVASCLDTGACYVLEVDDPASRPALQWVATFDETLDDPNATARTWALHIGRSFGDVPPSHPFYRYIETMLGHGMAMDCGGGNFCPELPETRAMMAMAVLRGLEGNAYMPPACVDGAGVFADVPFDSPFCPWIEELHRRGVVAGCGGGDYCPAEPVTRGQMAVFLLKTLQGASYMPSPCAGLFADVPCSSLFADWIEDLFGRGITAGCGTSPPTYCPGASITRGQCAVFQSRTFDLRLYP